MTTPVFMGTDVRRWAFGAAGLTCLPESDSETLTARILRPRSDDAWSVKAFVGAVGNIDWIGAGEALTFQGPTSRHLPSSASESTLWSTSIYRRGALFATAPGRVSGCAIQGERLIAVVANASPRQSLIYAAPLDDLETWTLLETIERDYPTRTPWFFNRDGTEASHIEWSDDGGQSWLHTITIAADTVTPAAEALPGLAASSPAAGTPVEFPSITAATQCQLVLSTGPTIDYTIEYDEIGPIPELWPVTETWSAAADSGSAAVDLGGTDVDVEWSTGAYSCVRYVAVGTLTASASGSSQSIASYPWGDESVTMSETIDVDYGAETVDYALTVDASFPVFFTAAGLRLMCRIEIDFTGSGTDPDPTGGVIPVVDVPFTLTLTLISGAESSVIAVVEDSYPEAFSWEAMGRASSGALPGYMRPAIWTDFDTVDPTPMGNLGDAIDRRLTWNMFLTHNGDRALHSPDDMSWTEGTSTDITGSGGVAGHQLIARDYTAEGARDLTVFHRLQVAGSLDSHIYKTVRLYIDETYGRARLETVLSYANALEADYRECEWRDAEGRTLIAYSREDGGNSADLIDQVRLGDYKADGSIDWITITPSPNAGGGAYTTITGYPYLDPLWLDPRHDALIGLRAETVGLPGNEVELFAVIAGDTLAVADLPMSFLTTLYDIDQHQQVTIGGSSWVEYRPAQTDRVETPVRGAAVLVAGGEPYALASVQFDSGSGGGPQITQVNGLVGNGTVFDPGAITGLTGDNPRFYPVGVRPRG